MEKSDEGRHHEEAPRRGETESLDLLDQIGTAGLHDITHGRYDHEPTDKRNPHPDQEPGENDHFPGRPGCGPVFPPGETTETDQTEEEEGITQDPNLGREPGAASAVAVGDPDHVDQSTEQGDTQSGHHRRPAHAMPSVLFPHHLGTNQSARALFINREAQTNPQHAADHQAPMTSWKPITMSMTSTQR